MHHQYVPIMPHTLYTEMVNSQGENDHDLIADYYNKHLEKSMNLTDISWTAAELIWHESGGTIITVPQEIALHLMIASSDIEQNFPALPKTEMAVYCYEFPSSPQIPLCGTILTAVLIVVSENHLIVWQGINGLRLGVTWSPEEFMREVNRQIDLPPDFEMSCWPYTVTRRPGRSLPACRGFREYRDYCTLRDRCNIRRRPATHRPKYR